MSTTSSQRFCLRSAPRLDGLIGVTLLLSAALLSRARADLIGYWNMNDFEDPTVVLDRSGNDNDGDITSFNEAFDTADPAWEGVPSYTDDGGGVTGSPGDRALDFGAVRNGAIVNLPTAADGAFDSIAENDEFTIAFWAFGGDDLPAQTVVFAFYHDPALFDGDHRMISVHLPWSNSKITYDTGGCCGGENRVSKDAELAEFQGQWNHYAFLKESERIAIYLNGELWLEGFGKKGLNPFATAMFGGGRRGKDALRGDITWGGLLDEFRVYDEALGEDEIAALLDVVPPDEPPTGAKLVPGDINGDGEFNISDPVTNLNLLFGGAGVQDCYKVPDSDPIRLSETGLAITDFNGDGNNNITDAVAALSFLFGGAQFPPHALGEGCATIEGSTCEDTCQ